MELEEGDAYFDPDVDLSYIDEKIQHVLGQFQKDFEGGEISAENLGAKFGGYGSFLPSYQRSPIGQVPKTPQRNHKTQRSPENPGAEFRTMGCVTIQGAIQNAKLLHITRVPPAVVTSIKDSCLKSTRIAEKSSMMNGALNYSDTPSEHRKTKIRLKLTSNNKVPKNAAIYSGLGLDNTPSSSLENSPELDGGFPPEYRETPDESPSVILQILTSFPVPGDIPISPMHDSLLCLTKKEIPPKSCNSLPILKTSQEDSAKLADGSASTTRVVNGLKEKETGLVAKTIRLRENANCMSGFENVSTDILKKKSNNKTSESKKFISNDLKFKIPFNSRCDANAAAEPLKQNIGQKAKSHEYKGITLSCRIGDKKIEGRKKSTEVQGNGKQSDDLAQESLRHSIRAAQKDKNNNFGRVFPSKSKSHKPTPQQDCLIVRDYNNDLLGNSELQRPDIRTKKLEKELNLSFKKSKEQSIGENVEKETVLKESLKEAPNGDLRLTENGLTSEKMPAGDASVVIEENWVSCDKCRKWRLLPYGTKSEQLPEKWLCSMLNWLSGMNRCNISEEETTEALQQLYLCPVPEMQTKLNSIPSRENEKYKSKEIVNADNDIVLMQISNATTNRYKESMENGSIVDDAKQGKAKNRRVTDEYVYTKNKKIKTEKSGSDIYHNSEGGDIGRVGRSSSTDFSTKASSKDMQKYNDVDVCSWKSSNSPVKDRASVSVNKMREESQLSLVGGSSVSKTRDERDVSLKKRKLEVMGNNQSHMNTSKSKGEFLSESEAFEQESIGREFRKEKKNGSYKVEGKQLSTDKKDDRSNKKGRATRIVLVVNKDRQVNGMEDARGNKDHEIQRQDEQSTPLVFSNGIDMLNRDLGSGHVLIETTSSSSKVSDSCRSRSKLQDIKCSPGMSIPASFLRNSITGNVTSEKVDSLDKSDVTKDSMHVSCNQGKCLDGESNCKSNRSGKMRKESEVRVLHNESVENSTLDYREQDANHKVDDKDDLSAHITRPSKKPEFADNQDGALYLLEHSRPSIHMEKDLNASSLVKKDPADQAFYVTLKEAKDLKDLADSLKSSGFGFESRVAHFQSARKFLLAASLSETCNSDNDRHGERTQTQLYSSTAKLCEFCALEYEGRQEMAAAALAYKCMEIAYMRAVYLKHFTTNRHELQATLQMLPQGESPSSSASDVDNLSIHASADRNALLKGSGSNVAVNRVIFARQIPNVIRLLDITQDVNLAMEASTKSYNAFAAAKRSMEGSHYKECIDFVKRAIDFSFQDVERFVRLVEAAFETINCSGFYK